MFNTQTYHSDGLWDGLFKVLWSSWQIGEERHLKANGAL